ncbi:MAG: antibiotic biosynthesis monooxygenase [Desulfobacterales bacterium]|nr:antibiotic biosynthesis monooxygenase [Desulfobacterales bacterium]
MAVQVLIRRKFVMDKAEKISPLMVALRSLARAQPGYLSSESLKCIDPPGEDEYLIRATWNSTEEWNGWLNSEERSAIQGQSDALTGEETQYRIYEPLVGGIHPK